MDAKHVMTLAHNIYFKGFMICGTPQASVERTKSTTSKQQLIVFQLSRRSCNNKNYGHTKVQHMMFAFDANLQDGFTTGSCGSESTKQTNTY